MVMFMDNRGMSEELPTSQIEAARQQLKHYQGQPCTKGHPGIRYTSSGQCVECVASATEARRERIRKLLRGEGA